MQVRSTSWDNSVVMNKKGLSERDICSKFISPAVKRAGWDGMLQIREEVAFTKGRIIVRGKLVSRGKAKRADYILYYKQHTPTVEAEEVSDIISKAKGRYKVLYALLAGTGLRIGEALALEIGEPSDERSGISADCKTIHVRKSVWRGKKQDPKTDNAVRDIDVPASLAAMLKDFIGNRTSGFVFQTKSGRPLAQRNIMRGSLRKSSETATFHAFRRFRITNLRETSVPEDLVRFWVGHADMSVTDRYSKMRNRIQVRQEWAEKVGLGFDLGPNGPKTVSIIPIKNVA